MPIETIRDVLVKLSGGDLLQYMELGGWFRKIDDPILLEFLKVWGRIEVEGHDRARVQYDLRTRYQTMERRIRDHKGYLAEVYMAQILWSAQRKTLPGRFFHSKQDITIPWHFSYVKLRTRLGTGEDVEIDVEGGAGKERWICESKWWLGKKAGRPEIESLIKKGKAVKEKTGKRSSDFKALVFCPRWFYKQSRRTDERKWHALVNKR